MDVEVFWIVFSLVTVYSHQFLKLRRRPDSVVSYVYVCTSICFSQNLEQYMIRWHQHIFWGFLHFCKLHKNKVKILDCVVLQERSILTLHSFFVHCFRDFCTVFMWLMPIFHPTFSAAVAHDVTFWTAPHVFLSTPHVPHFVLILPWKKVGIIHQSFNPMLIIVIIYLISLELSGHGAIIKLEG